MSRRTTWVALGLGLGLAVAGYFGFHALFVKVGRSVEQPFSGPARDDPYYVLTRYLEERGLAVRTVRSWPQPLARGVRLLWFTDAEVPKDVRAWLSGGGQLWSFRDPDPVEEPYEWEATPWPGDAQAEDDAKDQGDDLDDDCARGCLWSAQFRYGAGVLTLVESWGLQNEQVAHGETPARIDALLNHPKPASSVLIVTSVGSPWFGRLLLEHAPQALLAFAVVLGLSLWRAATYFGPHVPARKRERRQMLEHVGAVGMLAQRVGAAPLLAAARNQLRRQLVRRVPHARSLQGEPLVRAVADAVEVPSSEVQRALLDDLTNQHDLLPIARAMQVLWRKI